MESADGEIPKTDPKGEAQIMLQDSEVVATNAPAGEIPDWIELNQWARSQRLDAPRRIGTRAPAEFELDTPNGPLKLSAGTRRLWMDGIQCWLGFAPELEADGLKIHTKDAGANLGPLALSNPGLAPINRVIVIDPGHGGENTGARSVVDQRDEKEFTLDWGLRLKPLLESNGWQVFLTRTNDVHLTLPERVALAESVDASLFVSLHFNSAFPNRVHSGIETFCLTPTGLPSTLVREYEDDPTLVFPNNAFDVENLQWAVRLHRALLSSTGGADRGVRRARFMGVLRGQKRPAVLLEAGYLSNPDEARLIARGDYRQKLAESVAAALGSPEPKLAGPVEQRNFSSP